MNESSTNSILERFAHGQSLGERTAAVTQLLDEKIATRVSKEPLFEKGIDYLQRLAVDSGRGVDRVAAVAELVRIAQVVKSLQKELKWRLASAFEIEFPPARELKNPDSRFYLARACCIMSPGAKWLLSYVARAAIDEDGNAVKIRGEFLAAVVLNAQALPDIFRVLSSVSIHIERAKEKPIDSVARRITSVLSGLRPLIISSTIDAGDLIGSALLDLVKTAGGHPPETESVRIALAREVILTVFDIVRTRFSVSSDSDTYLAIGRMRKMFSGAAWPRELQGAIENLQSVIVEAIVLLGKQDIVDATLTDVLVLVCGYRERAEAILKGLAQAHPELPERVKAWLTTGRIPSDSRTDASLEESGLRSADVILASLMISINRLKRDKSYVSNEIVSALELYEPQLKKVLNAFLIEADDVVSHVEDMAGKRRLTIYGEIGELIEFSPKYFEFVGATPKQKVRVVRPAVARNSIDSGIGEVVLKGLVE